LYSGAKLCNQYAISGEFNNHKKGLAKCAASDALAAGALALRAAPSIGAPKNYIKG
jgi:hypothetical protein